MRHTERMRDTSRDFISYGRHFRQTIIFTVMNTSARISSCWFCALITHGFLGWSYFKSMLCDTLPDLSAYRIKILNLFGVAKILLSHEMASVFLQIEADHGRPHGTSNCSLNPPNLVFDNGFYTITDKVVIGDCHGNGLVS